MQFLHIQQLKKQLNVLIDITFPQREDARIVNSLSPGALLQLMSPRSEDGIVSLLPYKNTHVRACIHEVKFHKNLRAVDLLTEVLNTYIKTHPASVIIPIPLSKERQKSRGYNQVELLTHTVKTHVGTEIIYKVKDTPPQTTLTRADRLRNVRDVFAVYVVPEIQKKISGEHILLIDDVTTTGATLRAAEAVLTPYAPASITLLALAH